MATAALAILSRSPTGFLLVAEEEGTDNFANNNNAKGQMEALRRADAAIGVFNQFIERSPRTLMVMAADSEAGGLTVLGTSSLDAMRIGQNLPERDKNGAPIDGAEGTGSAPFLSQPDRAGVRHPSPSAGARRTTRVAASWCGAAASTATRSAA